MEKFLVVDVDGISDDENSVIEDVENVQAAIEVADEFADDYLNESEDNESIEVGIYKLVKTVTVVRKRTRTVTSVK